MCPDVSGGRVAAGSLEEVSMEEVPLWNRSEEHVGAALRTVAKAAAEWRRI